MPEPIIPPGEAPVTPPTPPNPTPPASTPPTGDPVELARKLGEVEAKNKELQEYREKTQPVLETLWSDTELLDKATQVHNKRMGIAPSTPPTPPTPPGNTPPADSDTRKALSNSIMSEFEKNKGITALPDEQKKDMRGKVGVMLKTMLDPQDNKTIEQVLNEVSLTKLPWYLENAYDLVTKKEQIDAAKEQGKSEVISQYEGDRGSIGSVAGGSIPPESITLTLKEKEIAKKQGVSEEDYLKFKKQIAQDNA